ncbi:MAG: hypothetical protein EOO52_19375 [Gammaproteobacteria bacterium]|nr:MAG: hypothetical protein EOO52_19375 [Gammaproteobacteria bacterium]
MKKFVPMIIILIMASFFTGMNAIASDSDEARVKPIKTSTMYQFDGGSKEKEVGGAQSACELYIKDECSINDCSDRHWKIEGQPEIRGTYVYCNYTGDNGLKMDSSPASIKLICPENAESSWDGEASYCKCITDFVARAGKCVAKVDGADEPSKSVALEEPPANPVAKPGDIGKPDDITKPSGETKAQSDARHAAEVEQYKNSGKEITTKQNAQEHHIASDKHLTKYTPIFRKIFDGAGLDIKNAPENLVMIKNHGGSHDNNGYHEAILARFKKVLEPSNGKPLEPGTPEYIAAVKGVLSAAKADLLQPDSELNRMVTKK